MAYIDGYGNMRDGQPEPYDMTNGQDPGYGDYSDWLSEQEPEPTWRTRDGKTIRIRDMGDGHLRNLDRAIRAGTVRTNMLLSSLIAGEISNRGLEPLPDFSCPAEAQATACVSALYTHYPRLGEDDRRRLAAAIAFETGDGDEAVHGHPEEDDLDFLTALSAVREFFRLRTVIADDDARGRIDASLETWLERQWDR